MTTGAMPIRQAFCGRMGSLPSVIPAMIDPGGEHPLAGSVHDEFDFASLRVIAFHFDPAIVTAFARVQDQFAAIAVRLADD